MRKIILLIITSLCLILTSCGRGRESNIIFEKSLIIENPNLSTYKYGAGIGWDWSSFVDSSNKFEIGDDIRKYSITFKK